MADILKSAPVLITGAAGFIGKNLTARLAATGYNNLMLFDKDTDESLLFEYCKKAVFVFHLAGVNRPKDTSEFQTGNTGFTAQLLKNLAAAGNNCPVLATSSTQAGLDNAYGKSKLAAEEALFAHANATGAHLYLFRLPGVFGKWCRPAYNSVVATFCHNVANGLPLEVRDENFELDLVYIDDVVDTFLNALTGVMPPCNCGFCNVHPVHKITLGQLAKTIEGFAASRSTLAAPGAESPLAAALYSTFLSYLPKGSFAYPLTMHTDARGAFTEFMRFGGAGQVSVNISNPGITKGNHWHDSKNEKFLVVQGQGEIKLCRYGEEEVEVYPVSGEVLTVVDIPTGYTHSIVNTGPGRLITIIWANEVFNPDKPDTNYLEV